MAITAERLQVVVTSSGAGSAADELAEVGEGALSAKTAVGLLGGALAALSVGGMAAAVAAAARFQTEMVELEKVTNPQTAREMSGAIQEMAETIPLAQSALAQIAADAGRFGIRGPQNIRNFTEAVAKMSTATDLSAQRAGQALAKLATLTKTPVNQIENLGSVINTLSNNFATSSSEIVDNMLRSAAAMTQFGLSQREIAGFAATLNAVSESSERAGTRLRRLVQEIANPKKVMDLASALGMNVQQFKAMQRTDPAGLLRMMAVRMREGGKAADTLNTTLSTTSRQALAGLGQNIKGLDRALGMANDEFRRGTSLQHEFEAASKTFNSQLQLLRNRLVNVGITIGSQLLPPLTQLVKYISQGIDVFMRFNDATGGVLAPATLASGAIVGLTAAMYGLAGTGAAAAVAAVGAALVTVGPALIATTALVTALGVAWKRNLFGIRDVTYSVLGQAQARFTQFTNRVRAVMTTVVNAILAEWQRFGPQITAIIRSVTSLVLSIVRTVTSLMQRIWSKHGQGVIDVLTIMKRLTIQTFRAIASVVVPILRTLTRVALTVIQTFVNVAAGFWRRHKDEVTWLIMTLVDGIVAILRRLGPIISRIVQTIAQLWRTYISPLLAFSQRIFMGILSLTQRAFGGVLAAVRRIFPKIKRIIQASLAAINAAWTQYIQPLIAVTRRVFTQIKNVIQSVIRFIQSTVISPFLGWLSQQWAQHGTVILREARLTWNAIQSAIATVVNAIKRIVGPILNWLSRTWNTVHSKLSAITSRIWGGISSRVNSETQGIRRSIGRETATMQSRWNQWGNRLTQISRQTWTKIQQVVRGGMDATEWVISGSIAFITGAWRQWGDEMINIARFAFDAIKGTIEFALAGIKTAIVAFLRVVRGDFRGAWNAIASHYRQSFNGMLNFIRRWGGMFISRIRQAIRDLIGLGGAFRDAGEGLMDSFAAGIRNTIGKVTGSVGDAVQRVRNMLPGSDAKEGPLSDLTAAGTALPQTLAAGMVANLRPVGQAAQTVAREARPEPSVAIPADALGGRRAGRSRRSQTTNHIMIEVDARGARNPDAVGTAVADELRSVLNR